MTASRRAASPRRSRAAEPAPPTSIQSPEQALARKGGAAAPTSAAAAAVAPLPGAPGMAPGEDGFDGQYRVKLDSFEGPLDLLLHLIQQHELDILDIPVSFITEKYLEYLKLMQVLSIEIASEYLVMAATLVHIKSKMLLPTVPTGQDDGMPQEEEEDPRAELVRRLLEYQKYKAAAAELAERGTLGRDVFPRGAEESAEPGPAPFARVEVFGLLEAFEKILKKTKVKLDHEVVFDRISITDRIVELTEKLQGRRAVRFEQLFLTATRHGPPTRFDLVITFLAMLEMCRMKLLRVYQTGPLAPIYMGLIDEIEDLTEEERAHADSEAATSLDDAPPSSEEAESPKAPAPPLTAPDPLPAQLVIDFPGEPANWTTQPPPDPVGTPSEQPPLDSTSEPQTPAEQLIIDFAVERATFSEKPLTEPPIEPEGALETSPEQASIEPERTPEVFPEQASIEPERTPETSLEQPIIESPIEPEKAPETSLEQASIEERVESSAESEESGRAADSSLASPASPAANTAPSPEPVESSAESEESGRSAESPLASPASPAANTAPSPEPVESSAESEESGRAADSSLASPASPAANTAPSPEPVPEPPPAVDADEPPVAVNEPEAASPAPEVPDDG